MERIDLRAYSAPRFARIMPCLLVLIAAFSMLHLLAARLCWLLGAAMQRWLSTPCDRWLRGKLMRSAAAPMATHRTVANTD